MGGFRLASVDVTLFGETFKWNILGYDAAPRRAAVLCAYMIAMVIGECINFPIQRNFVFRSKRAIWASRSRGMCWHSASSPASFNSINCVWVAVAGLLVPDFIYNISTTVLKRRRVYGHFLLCQQNHLP